LVIIATNKIIDVRTPNTIVPPKLENANIINPKKRINDVKIIDLPVWFMVLIIESSKLLLRSSFLNFARK
jgi:hypothetical protein|tara:strand:+ start:1107 stop:1316 length:210 start_codon:yes stop_codon:yes gene_type:complete